ncbi:C39 family peptidase [Leptospira idonii]|nr:C39 family peptidase [Leptospira idonii]
MKKYPDRSSLTSISPLPWYDPQTDNIAVKILNRLMNRSNTCMGTTYLTAVKWAGHVLGTDSYDSWTEKEYYSNLEEFVIRDIDITTSSYHNKLFNSLFGDKAKATQVKFSVTDLIKHIKNEKAPVIFSIDVRKAFNPKATSPMGHIVMAVAQCSNGITIHDPRGKYDTKYNDLQGANSFFSYELLEEIARKEVMNLISIPEKKKKK